MLGMFPPIPKNEYELYFAILEDLSKNAFVKRQSIAGPLITYFGNHEQIFYGKETKQEWIDLMILFARKMEDAGHIVLNTQGQQLPDDPVHKGSKDWSILATITPEGFIFLNNERIRKSNRKNFNIQAIFTVITTIFIGITTLYAVFEYKLHIKEISDKKPTPVLVKPKPTLSPKKDSITHPKNHIP